MSEDRKMQAELYVFGGMDDQEKDEFEAYMKQSPECRAYVAELMDIVSLLPYSLDQEVPPPVKNKEETLQAVMQRIEGKAESSAETREQASVGKKKWRNKRLWPYFSIAAAVAFLFLGVQTMASLAEVRELSQKNEELNQELFALTEELEETEALLRSEATLAKEIGRLENATALKPLQPFQQVESESMIMSKDDKQRNLLFKATNLPPVEGSQTYTVWVEIDGQAHNAGSFTPHQGQGVLLTPIQPGNPQRIMITLEPEPGRQTPSEQVISEGRF
jgi:anti-sigma-K factor RskA